MPSISHAAGESVIVAALRADDSSAAVAEANGVELARALDAAVGSNATIQLPAGTLYVSRVDPRAAILELDERHAGITIQGAGPGKTVLYDPSPAPPNQVPIVIVSRAVAYFSQGKVARGKNYVNNVDDIADYQLGDVVYFWIAGTPHDDLRQRLIVTGISGTTLTLSGNVSTAFATDPSMKHVKGSAVSGSLDVGSTTVQLLDSSQSSRYAVGDDAMIGDGPAVNEFFAEWVRITQIDSNGTIHFAPPLRQKFDNTRACIVPPPHLTDVTLRDLAFLPSASSPTYFGFLKLAVRVAFERVSFMVASPAVLEETAFNFVNCDWIWINQCQFTLVTFGVCHDTSITNSTALKVRGEEFCFDFQFTGVTISGAGGILFWTHDQDAGECQRIHMTSSRVLATSSAGAFALPEGSKITDVKIRMEGTYPVYLNDDSLRLTNVECNVPVHMRGVDNRIVNLTAPHLYLDHESPDPPSSGVLATPLLPDPTAITDSTPVGNWRYPVTADKNGSVVLEPADAVGLTVARQTVQTVNLFEIAGLSSALFAVTKDGDVVSSRITTDTTAGALQGKLKVLDANNTPYYIRLYAS